MLSRRGTIRLFDMSNVADIVQQQSTVAGYVPPEVGPEIYVGTIAALVPIVYATFEFSKRIIIQKRCLVCNGSGLTYTTRNGNTLKKLRKCWSCGGFIPWLGWERFFLTTVDVGNGGVLQRPAEDYEETNERIRKEKEKNQEK